MISRFEKILLITTVFLTGGTGLAYAWMKYLMKSADPFSVVNHPWQPFLLAAHVLAAPALLFALGLITREHIVGKYRDPKARRGRKTGIVLAWILPPMVVTGYGLQVLTSRGPRQIMGWAHLAVGVLFLLLYGAHALLSSPGKAREGVSRAARSAAPVAARRLKRQGDAL
ncbi:MAG: hypothetical protein L0Z52_07100 [Acidobacteria bacterium]|nr:hypothetical protein [Acidobacteriota bacterium]